MYISVVIPLYNKEKHISRAVNSVLNQTYKNFELIIIDDGSTDGSLAVVEKFDDSRIKVFTFKNNGVSVARNLGIEKAKYSYIAFLDADDEWEENFLLNVKKLIQTYPECGMYATLYKFKNNNKVRYPKLNLRMKKGQSAIIHYFKAALIEPVVSASSVVIKKDVFNDLGGFLPELNRGEDLEMWIRIALKYDVAFLNKDLVTYNLDASNRITQKKRSYSQSLISKSEEILSKELSKGNNDIYFYEYMVLRILSKVKYYIDEDEYLKARKILKKYSNIKFIRSKWLKHYILTFKLGNLLYQSALKIYKKLV